MEARLTEKLEVLPKLSLLDRGTSPIFSTAIVNIIKWRWWQKNWLILKTLAVGWQAQWLIFFVVLHLWWIFNFFCCLRLRNGSSASYHFSLLRHGIIVLYLDSWMNLDFFVGFLVKKPLEPTISEGEFRKGFQKNYDFFSYSLSFDQTFKSMGSFVLQR